MHIYLAHPPSSADDEAAGADGWEYREGIALREKDGTFSNTERRVQRVRKAVEPPGEARTDWQIVCEISSRMGYGMNYPDAEAIFDEMRKLTPSYAGITYERIDKGGLQWPCPNEDHPGTKYLYEGKLSQGKGKFFAVHYTPAAAQPDLEYSFLLTTGNESFRGHTETMTSHSPALSELPPGMHGGYEQ